MTMPLVYNPQMGYRYQILCRNRSYSRHWDHCDYARNKGEKDFLLKQYTQAYGAGWEYKVIVLPKKYWS